MLGAGFQMQGAKRVACSMRRVGSERHEAPGSSAHHSCMQHSLLPHPLPLPHPTDCAQRQSRDEIERTFLSQALLMCQDLDFHIRTTMCEQLVGIGRAVGGELLSRRVLDEALELLKDESVQVSRGVVTRFLWDLRVVVLELCAGQVCASGCGHAGVGKRMRVSG